MRTWISILVGPTAADARPVFTSSDPRVIQAALSALDDRLNGIFPASVHGPGEPEGSTRHPALDEEEADS